MKWRLSGFSQVVQIRAPVSAAELRFPPARTSQQTSTSIIRLMDLIRAGAASPGLGAGEARGAGGQRSPRRYLALPVTWLNWRVCANSISSRLFQNKRDFGIASPGSPTLPPSLHLITLSPPSDEHPRPGGLRRVPVRRQCLSAEPGSPPPQPGPGARPRVGAAEEDRRGFCKTDLKRRVQTSAL